MNAMFKSIIRNMFQLRRMIALRAASNLYSINQSQTSGKTNV
ncbi:hypothetical protein RESH_06329 [Rhodopirellula europaea SH398]|uniref:Uncharacterized protein n=1 Tax=Rhodopirellula europaea SH398 TaxID=1263868 RepID=M5SA99_9BACT|nr:hypothetical protein RESH_06329 [Rhodopirellula europaea SH398]